MMAGPKGNILIVDDIPENVRILFEVLSQEGYDVRAVTRGDLAIKAARSVPFNIILLDIHMPEMNGYEVCQALKADRRTAKIPVIFISALDEMIDKARAFEAGGVDYITKPFEAEEILLRVANHLALRRSNEELAAQKSQIEEQARRLMELDEVKSRFFANISHEFRTPLTLISARLDDLRRYYQGSQAAQAGRLLDLLKNDAYRLDHLIQQLLDLSKMEAGMMSLNLRSTDLIALLRDLLLTFASLAERKEITVTFDAPPESVFLDVDPEAIVKVFTNLLSNAFKFTPPGGRVRVECRRSKKEGVDLLVQDTGPGIPAEALPHVFERYYQAELAYTPDQIGMGIGLALSRELVQLHGGTIGVESTVGQGSLFAVALPTRTVSGEDIVQDQGRQDDLFRTARHVATSVEQDYVTEQQKPDIPLMDENDEDRTVVLIADDNPSIRALVRSRLEPEYRVLEARNGKEGMECARQCLPDLVITDVMMPEMDGYAFVRALRQDPELDFIPIIMLTVKASADNKLEGLREGVDDYLTKPFEVRELQARVRNLIATRERLRERFMQEAAALPKPDASVMSSDQRFLERARAVVEAHLSDASFSVEKMASELALDRSTLYRHLRSLVDQSTVDFVRSIRLERAAQLLAGRTGTVSEIAYGVGFKSVAYFSTCFSKKYGITPSAYMRAKE
ncbi:MAG: response regulator [Rhodothermales bacterium]